MIKQIAQTLTKMVLQFALAKAVNLLFQRSWAHGCAHT